MPRVYILAQHTQLQLVNSDNEMDSNDDMLEEPHVAETHL
jgi:hypothetical protein